MPTSGWSPERVRDVYTRTFREGRLVLVSNREPYAHMRNEKGEISVQRPAGGLALALDPVLQAVGGTWVAWGHASADHEAVDDHDRLGVPPEDPAYTLRRLWLSEGDIDYYYLGYSNQALWPLCHNILEHVRFRSRYWQSYRDVNTRFAHAVVEEAGDGGGLVWFQDYHLALAPAMLRNVRSDLTLSHFWHIPWPAWETYRVCPQKIEILEGLLANDLLGFHLDSFVTNFITCCIRELDAFVDWTKRAIVYKGHMTAVKAFPISIDVERFEEMAASEETQQRMAAIVDRYALGDQKIGIGVDRLDYSKGILERLEALRMLFRDHPELVGRFTFVQIAVPSRGEIPAYQHLQERVDRRIEELNAALADDGWKPIVYIRHPLPQDELVAFYRMADVAVISSVQDGMNLVVKEYIASQGEDPGAVCLSEFAGAADEIGRSVSINPFDAEGFAESLRRALEMPLDERRQRMAAMRQNLRRQTVYTWMADFLGAAGAVRGEAASVDLRS